MTMRSAWHKMKRIYQPPGHEALLFYAVTTTDKVQYHG